MPKFIDWQPIRRDYEGGRHLEALALTYDLNPATIKKRIRAEDWRRLAPVDPPELRPVLLTTPGQRYQRTTPSRRAKVPLPADHRILTVRQWIVELQAG